LRLRHAGRLGGKPRDRIGRQPGDSARTEAPFLVEAIGAAQERALT
jgi:hypothetical protein